MRAINYIDIGYLTNNITSDVIRVHIFIVTSIHIVATPLFLCFFLVILLIEIGVYCLAGIGILLLLLGITMVIGKFIAKATASKLKLSGVRNKETTFMLTGMKSIKFNCWEEVMEERIKDLKRQEKRWIYLYNALRNLLEGLYNITPTIAGFVTILIFNFVNEVNLELGRVFFVLASFNTLIVPLRFFYISYSNMEQVIVSLKNIESFLKMPDFQSQIQREALPIGQIQIKNCTSSYKERNFDKNVREKLKGIKKKQKEKSDENKGIFRNFD